MSIETYLYPEKVINVSIPGISTEAKQDDEIIILSSIDSKLPVGGLATSAKQDTGNTSLGNIDTKLASQATAAKQDTGNVSLSSIDTKLTSQATAANQTTTNTKLDSIIANSNALNVVDQIDTTPLLDTSSINITASAGNPVQVVASLAANVKKIVSVEDIGEFIGVYTGAALSETLLCVLPLGGGEINAVIPATTRISLRNMKNAAISSGMIALNFIG